MDSCEGGGIKNFLPAPVEFFSFRKMQKHSCFLLRLSPTKDKIKQPLMKES